MYKRMLLMLVGIALTMQLAGCFYVGEDHHWHHDHERYYEHQDHQDNGIDVHLHG